MDDLITRLGRRIAAAFGICRLTKESNYSENIQMVQGCFQEDGENNAGIRDNLFLVQEYGFASRPIVGSDAVCLFLGGTRTKGVIVATGDLRDAPTDIKAGEVCVYHPQTGSRVYLQENGDIHLKPKDGQKIILDGDAQCTGSFISEEDLTIKGALEVDKDTTLKGELSVSKDISSKGDIKAGEISLENHIHPTSGLGDPTGKPQ